MGAALMWCELLAAALLFVALETAWAARGRRLRRLWVATIGLVLAAPSLVTVLAGLGVFGRHLEELGLVLWFGKALTWGLAFVAGFALVIGIGWRRPGAGLAPHAAAWPRRSLWLWLGGAVLAVGFTFWNLDLAARADLAIARQEAGAALLDMSQPPVAEADNAAPLYLRASAELGDVSHAVLRPWSQPLYWAHDPGEKLSFRDAELVEVIQRHQKAIGLLRKAAAMPGCHFPDFNRASDFWTRWEGSSRNQERLHQGLLLLVLDAGVAADQGETRRAFDDVDAALGMTHHLGRIWRMWGSEVLAWRALEKILPLVPDGKEPLPALRIPEPIGLVRDARAEEALLSMILPMALSDPSPLIDRQPNAAWFYRLMLPPVRVAFTGETIADLRHALTAFNRAPLWARDETPKAWSDLEQSAKTPLVGAFGETFLRPKFLRVTEDASTLAGLRATAPTGLAVANYRRKHGKLPTKIDELVPEFLPAIPRDPRDEQPLALRHEANGVVVIYPPRDVAVLDGPEPARRRLRSSIFRVYPPRANEAQQPKADN